MSSGCSGIENDQASLVAEISPGLSHQEILCNKEALERRLSLRRARGELVDQGIIPAVSAAPSILSQRARLERAQTGDILQKKIRVRPNRAQLIQRHILQETTSSVDPSLIAKQIQLQRKKLEDDLNDRLTFRPGPLELVKDHILEADTAVGLAVQTGQVNYTGTADLLEPISPESQEGSPVASPVEESQPTPTTGPSQAEIQFQEQQLQLQLQIQQQKQLQQQQQQQHIQSLLQHQQHLQRQQQQQQQQQQAPVQLGGGSRKESRRRKTSKAKFKKYKYHEYRPPNATVQKSELASDSPYGLLLQQQQLYLQLQVLYQHYPNQYPLPAIPENGKLVNSGGKNGNNGEKEKPIKIEDMRVVDMRKELKSRGLPVSGSKTDLIERLKLADAQVQASSPATSAEMVMTASPPATVTTVATTEMQAQGLVVSQDSHGGLQRSNSMPMQAVNVPSLQQQLQIQIMANKQNLQNMNLPPDVQQQLQHLQYLNLQFQLEQLKIQQQQQNIQPKPQQSGQSGTLIKQETHTLANCGIKNSQSMPNLSPQQQQAKKQAPQQSNVGLVISPPTSAPVSMKRPLAQQQAQALPVFSPQEPVRSSQDSVQPPVNQSQSLPQGQPNSSVSHHQDEVRTLPNEDGGSRKNSQDVLGISWQQQHPLFDGDSPASVDSSVFSQSPLEAKSLDNLDFIDSGKAENRPLHRTCSERSADYQQELLIPTQTKPRSMSEPHFQPGHRRSTSFPTMSYSVPPPSYEAHMAAQYQNHVASSDHLQLGYDDSQSMKSEDMEVAMDQCMQDKEIRALHKAMLTSFETDELLGLLGGNNNCPPSENRSHFSLGGMQMSYPIPSSTSCVPSQYSNAIPRSPSGSFLHSVATNHHMPSRISKSCDDVSILNHGLKTVSNFEQNHIPDIDSFMGPASPIRADMATDIEEMNSGELFHSSNSIPIPSSNMHKSEPLSWLDLSLSPSHTSGSTSPMNSVPTFTKEALPNSLYDTVSPLRQDEVFSLSLFDLETPTLLHAPAEFPEAMETGFV